LWCATRPIPPKKIGKKSSLGKMSRCKVSAPQAAACLRVIWKM
jgi:hypothetical protein